MRILTCCAVFLAAAVSHSAEPQWIWKSGKVTTEKAHFRTAMDLAKKPAKALLRMTCDNGFTLMVNGKKVASSTDWQQPVRLDIAKHLKKGSNQFLIQANNEGNIAGLIFDLRVDGKQLVSNAGWEAQAPGGAWHKAVVKGKHGAGPWGEDLAGR